MPMKLTKSISLQPNNAKHRKGLIMNSNEETEYKPLTIPNSKLLIGSEKLFLTPIRNNFAEEFKDEHFIILMDHHDRSALTSEELRLKKKEYYNQLSLHWEVNYTSRVFVGYGQDCLYLFDLYTDFGIIFDAAVLIDFNFDSITTGKSIINGIKKHTKIYNFYSDDKTFKDEDLAHTNQYIPTRIFSPTMSKRFAQETAGVLTYEIYNQLCLQHSPSQYRMIQQTHFSEA